LIGLAPGLAAPLGHASYASDHASYATDHAIYATDHAIYASDHASYATDHAIYATDHASYATDHTNYASGRANYASSHAVRSFPGLCQLFTPVLSSIFQRIITPFCCLGFVENHFPFLYFGLEL